MRNTLRTLTFISVAVLWLMLIPTEVLALSKNDLSGTYFTHTLRFVDFGEPSNEELISQRMELNFDQKDTWTAVVNNFKSDSSTSRNTLSGTFSVHTDSFVLHGISPKIVGFQTRDKSTILVSIADVAGGDTIQMFGFGVKQKNRNLELSDFSSDYFGTAISLRDIENEDGDSRGFVLQQNLVPDGDGSGESERNGIFNTQTNNRENFLGNRGETFSYETRGTYLSYKYPGLDTTPKRRLHLAKNRNAGLATQSGTDVEEGSVIQSLNIMTPVCEPGASASDFSGTYAVRGIKIVDLQDTDNNRSLEHISGFYNFRGNDTSTAHIRQFNSQTGLNSSDTTFTLEAENDFTYSFSFPGDPPEFEQVTLNCNKDHFVRAVGDNPSDGDILKLVVGIKIRNKLDGFEDGECLVERLHHLSYFSREIRMVRDHLLNIRMGRFMTKNYYTVSNHFGTFW